MYFYILILQDLHHSLLVSSLHFLIFILPLFPLVSVFRFTSIQLLMSSALFSFKLLFRLSFGYYAFLNFTPFPS